MWRSTAVHKSSESKLCPCLLLYAFFFCVFSDNQQPLIANVVAYVGN